MKRGKPLKRSGNLKRTPLKRRRSKYGNVKVGVGLKEYDSKLEADRAMLLGWREKAGEISDLKEQVHFFLTKAKIEYIADFQYVENGRVIVEDTKGVATAVFSIKARLWRHYGPGYPLHVIEGVYSGRTRTGWKTRKIITSPGGKE